MQTVLSTPDFDEQAASIRLGDPVLDRVVDDVGEHPLLGKDFYQITGLKLRTMQPVATGAESAIDVLSYWAGNDVPVFLLDVSYSGEALKMTAAEKVELERTVSGIAAEYRANQQKKILEFRKGGDV